MTPVKLDLPYLTPDPDRHGNDRLYVRKNGRKIRIRQRPGTPEFLIAYNEALETLDGPASSERKGPRAAPSGSLGWLAACYFASTEFKALEPKSQATRRSVIESCLQEPRKPGAPDLMAACPIARLSAKHVRMLRDRKADMPGAANNRRKYLSSMFGWAAERELITSNPARDVKILKYATGGFHSWSVDEVKQYEARHPVGTKARLAMALLLFLGPRRQDVVRLGKQHMRGPKWLRFAPKKTSRQRVEETAKPVLPVLSDIIAASPTGPMTFLETAHGVPFTANGFGNWFRDRCDEAGLPQCSAHGLRKAGASLAAENGATVPQLMALYDWKTEKQAIVYIRAANQRKMSGQAGALLALGDQTENEDESPHERSA